MPLKRDDAVLRSFTKDVQRYDPTIFQYIGELCRYLLAAPENPNDANNRLRLAVGNGLRPDVWEKVGVDACLLG